MICGSRCVALAFISAFFFVACGAEQETAETPARPVKAVKVGDVARFSQRPFPGRAKATEEVDLAFEVNGIMTRRFVDKGDEVKKGQLLARLDPRDYKNELDAAKAERDQAKSYLERIRRALRSGAVSRQDLTDAQARFDITVANVSIKAKALEDARIVAPYDGIVAATYAENFQRVRAKEKIIRFLDISKIEMDLDIPESLISFVPHVKEVFVRFDAFPGREEVPARIKEIGTEASQTTRTYPVTIIMDQPEDITILPGMAGQARGEAELPENFGETGIEVPVSATFSPDETGKTYIWVIDESTQTVKRREVKTGKLTDRGIIIQKGLRPGEWVATAGVNYLREGQRVRILGEESKGASR